MQTKGKKTHFQYALPPHPSLGTGGLCINAREGERLTDEEEEREQIREGGRQSIAIGSP